MVYKAIKLQTGSTKLQINLFAFGLTVEPISLGVDIQIIFAVTELGQ